jgi:UDP-2,4-diacetamido-2,4,6-trideoxy-beta-L-altropyranose hydrolase
MTGLFLRADGNVKIGSGHVMRCLSIAEAWQDSGGAACYGMTPGGAMMKERVTGSSIRAVDIPADGGSAADARYTIAAAREFGADWIVLDGYDFNSVYQRSIKDSGFRLLVIDDFGNADHYWADVVLNHHIAANEGLYAARERYTTLLLGPKYVQLRREFGRWQGWRRISEPAGRRILVSLGGADADNVTLKVMRGLQLGTMDGGEAVIVVGSGSPHAAALQREAAEMFGAKGSGRLSVQLLGDVRDMPRLMAWADAAVIGAGTTAYEAAYMGLPSLTIVVAENQVAGAAGLAASGSTINLGWHGTLPVEDIAGSIASLLNDFERRASMARVCQATVDGEGSSRLLMHLHEGGVRLRAVRPSDCELVWSWANEPSARAMSFSVGEIPWDDHVAWFERKIRDPQCLFYIAVDRMEQPVGQVRFDIEGARATISINVDLRFRGRRLGSQLVTLGSREVFQRPGVTQVDAFVKPANAASERVFTRAGFVEKEVVHIRGDEARLFTLSKADPHRDGADTRERQCGQRW